jgi:hypothetical protein
MDLGPLLRVEQALESLLAIAVARLAAGDGVAASRNLSKAQALGTDPLIGHLKGFLRSLTEDPHGPDDRCSAVDMT